MADIFNEDGKYNKTDWESGDRITANKLNRIEMAIEQINDNDNQRHVEADGRLDSLEAGLTETKDKVDNIDMAYKTADTVLTNRVNSVETSYKAADTTLNNRVNSVETAYKTSETNLTNKFNNLNTAYQNAVSNLTAKFNSLETAYKAADTKMTNNINSLDAAYKAADTTLQNNIDALDADIQEVRNEIPTSVSQLEYDINDNLISNGRFVGAKPGMIENQLESWTIWGDISVNHTLAYNDVHNAIALRLSTANKSGGIHQQVKDYRLKRGIEATLSFFCDWQLNVNDPEYVIKFQLDNVDVEAIYGFCVKGNQAYTFTIPDVEFDTILVGFKSELGLKEQTDSYINMYVNHVKLEVGDKATAWCEKQHNIATRQYVDNQNYCIHGANGTSGSTGYVKVCSIKVIGDYANSPIVIKFARRRDEIPKEVIINFNSATNMDPGIASLYIRGRSRGVAYIHKSAPSIYDLWIAKSEAYDHIGIFDVQMTKYQADRVKITYTNDHANALPDGYISPTAYNGFYIPESGDWFNNGTPIVRDDGVFEVGKFLDFHLTNASTEDYEARLRVGAMNNLHCETNLLPGKNNTRQLGDNSYRWQYIRLTNQPDVSSDRTLKENITYVKNEKAKSEPVDEVITYKDMYDFVKDDLELATYNFKGQEEQSMNFIAQDLLYNLDGTDNKIGQMIINPVAPPTEEEIEEAKSNMDEDQEYTYPTLSYDMGMYISVLAGALKTALNKIDALEEQIASITQQQE